jgi:ribonuclease R
MSKKKSLSQSSEKTTQPSHRTPAHKGPSSSSKQRRPNVRAVRAKSHAAAVPNQELSPRHQHLFDNLLKTTNEFVKGRQYAPHTKGALIERLNVHPDNWAIFEKVLETLKIAGTLSLIGEQYHRTLATESPRLAQDETIVRGTISTHPRGFGFVNQPSPKEDIFIPKAAMNGAIDGDVVDIVTNLVSCSPKGPEGRVLNVVERKRSTLVGTVTESQGKQAIIYSSLLGELHPIVCQLKPSEKVKKGDRVVLKVLSWGQKKEPTECLLDRVLGNVADPRIDIPFVVEESGIRHEFSKATIEEAQQFGTRVKPSELKNRTDVRDLECITIDPDTAKDFDDAISIEMIGSTYRVGVHIADVSHYVRPNSALDIEARQRCNSTYFPNTCNPMLPRELSENLCSLKPKVARLTVSVFFDVTESGDISEWEIVRSVIKSQQRLTYSDAKRILDGTMKSAHAPLLHRMAHVCELLKNRRRERGSVQLYVPELIVKIDDMGCPTGMERVEYDITHQMVEELMLKANEIVAIQLGRNGKEVSYRVHEEPAEEALRDFSSLVASFGFHLPEVPTPQDMQQFFLEAEGSPHASYLAVCYIKSMRQACYSPDNIGHYGLSLEHYCHFTSPIRRYIDIIIHRLLLEEGPDRDALATICQAASEQERISARAEGSVCLIKKLRYLSQEQKRSPKKLYDAIITRVKPFGIFFDVVDIMLEGFLHVSELEDDYFLFNDDTSQLEGRNFGICYRSGEHLSVLCDRVDIVMQEASWHMVTEDTQPKRRMSRHHRQENHELS